MSDPNPVPSYFTFKYMWRYTVWLIWSNPLTIFLTIQSIFLQLTMDTTMSRPVVHWSLTGANMLGILIAQLKKNNPSPPPPTKGP